MTKHVAIELKKDVSLEELQTLVNNMRVGAWTATAENLQIIVWNYVDWDDWNSFLKLTGM